jgi:hypothetical protein
MDIDDIRRFNICALEKEAGTPKLAADRAGMSYAQYLNYRNGAKEAKTGKVRGMRKETAWRFEDAFMKPRGWLDKDRTSNRIQSDSAPVYAARPQHSRPLVRKVAELAEQIDDIGLRNLIDIAECLARNHPVTKAKRA